MQANNGKSILYIMKTGSSMVAEKSNIQIKSSNKRSYDKVQKHMLAGKLLTIDRLGQDSEGKPYIHVKTAKCEFYYFIKQSSWYGIRAYLDSGKVTDFDPQPEDDIVAESGDFKFEMFKGFVEEGIAPTFVEPLRSYPEYLTFKLDFRHGSIKFSFKRTEELVEKISELDPDYDL